MAEHMLQGAHIAEQQGESEDIIVTTTISATSPASRHVLDGGHARQAPRGSRRRNPESSQASSPTARYHVAAKRYIAPPTSYFNQLSEASIISVEGGPMNAAEIVSSKNTTPRRSSRPGISTMRARSLA